jgi:hypothetical protein
MIKHLLISFILISLLGVGSAGAQVVKEKRIELPSGDQYESFRIQDFGTEGVCVFAELNYVNTNGQAYICWRYDTNLNLRDSVKFEVPRGMFYSGLSASDGRLSLLFNKKRTGQFELRVIDPKELTVKELQGFFPKKSTVSKFHVIDDHLYTHLYIKQNSSLVINSLQGGANKVVPLKAKTERYESMQVLREEKLLFVYVNKIAKKENAMEVRIYKDGALLNQFMITEYRDHSIASISATVVDDREILFCGTYSDRSTSVSQGLFISDFVSSKRQFIQYHPFSDFDHFLEYLPEKRQAKLEKKKAKKQAQGKDFDLNILIASHELEPVGDDFIYLGEVFYPTYRTETVTTGGPNGTTTMTRRVFDGYQYTHAVVARFDSNGELVWDNIMQMFIARKPFVIKRFVHPSFDEQHNVTLVHSGGNHVNSKTISYNGVSRDQKSVAIDSMHEGDQIRWSVSEVSHWYDNTFLHFGTQKIKNSEGETGKRKRIVYFINKVSLTN